MARDFEHGCCLWTLSFSYPPVAGVVYEAALKAIHYLAHSYTPLADVVFDLWMPDCVGIMIPIRVLVDLWN